MTTRAFGIDEDTEAPEDPFRGIIEEEARAHSDEINRLGRDADEDEEESSSTGTSRDRGTGTSSVETRKETPDETAANGGGRRPGIDKVLQEINSKLGPEQASVVRSMVATANKSREAVREMMDRIELLEDRLVSGDRGQVEQPTEEVDPVLSRLSPEDWRVFQAMAERSGYVRRDELENEEVLESSSSFVNQDLDAGIKAYGEEFGTRDEKGNFEFAPEVADKTREVWDRLHDPKRGLTGRDLFILAKHDDLLREAARKGGRTTEVDGRRQEAKRAITEHRSATRATQPRMSYKSGKDDLESIIARASLQSMRERSR